MLPLVQQIQQSEKDLKEFINQRHKELVYRFNCIRMATLWYRWCKTDKGIYEWEFNHLEDGHCPNAVPTPKCELHKTAWRGKWAKVFVQLEKDKVAHYKVF